MEDRWKDVSNIDYSPEEQSTPFYYLRQLKKNIITVKNIACEYGYYFYYNHLYRYR